MQRHHFMCAITESIEHGVRNRRWRSSLKAISAGPSGGQEVDFGWYKGEPGEAVQAGKRGRELRNLNTFQQLECSVTYLEYKFTYFSPGRPDFLSCRIMQINVVYFGIVPLELQAGCNN